MKNFSNHRLPSFLLLPATALLMWLITSLPAGAQNPAPDCFTYQPTAATAVSNRFVNDMVSDRGEGLNGEKLRILCYYDPSIPASLNMTTTAWEALLLSNVMMFDTALTNACVTEEYENLHVRILPATVSIPSNTDAAYNDAAINQGSQVYQMWNSGYSCFQPHVICFIPPISGATGARGVATTITAPFASTSVGIVVVRSNQIAIGTDRTMAHELGHSLGGFHPGDAFAPNPSFWGVGTMPDGHRSIMKSPTNDMTVLNEGRLVLNECSALWNGTTDLGLNWGESYTAYTQSRPGFLLETTATEFYIFADSQTTILQAYANRANVDFSWTKNGYPFAEAEGAEFTYAPTAADTGVVTFQVTATNCGGEVLTSDVTIEVKAKPTTTTTGTSNPVWSGFAMFPNPVTTNLNFDRPYNVRLFDMTARLLLSAQNELRLDMSMLNSGVYVAVIEHEGNVTRRIVNKFGFGSIL